MKRPSLMLFCPVKTALLAVATAFAAGFAAATWFIVLIIQ